MSKVIHVLKQREKRVFYSFLATNNALKQFKQNCRYRGRDLDWVSSQYDFHIEHIINLSFCWSLQPEGDKFWQSLHRKWVLYIEQQQPFG
jgi:hypothetical protein